MCRIWQKIQKNQIQQIENRLRKDATKPFSGCIIGPGQTIDDMKWDSELYDRQHQFVSAFGESLTDLVNTDSDQVIWDLGCGTGILTAVLARGGAHVVGTDLSSDMIRQARLQYPGIDFRVGDAISIDLGVRVDTVFSNAVFHWIHRQQELLGNIRATLNPQGRIVCEMGTAGNIARIEKAFGEACAQHGLSCPSRFFFPSASRYGDMLRQAGFDVLMMEDFDRPTPFAGGREGMKLWLEQFYASQLEALSGEKRRLILEATEERLLPELWDGGQWVGDYRRLRFIAVKQ